NLPPARPEVLGKKFLPVASRGVAENFGPRGRKMDVSRRCGSGSLDFFGSRSHLFPTDGSLRSIKQYLRDFAAKPGCSVTLLHAEWQAANRKLIVAISDHEREPTE